MVTLNDLANPELLEENHENGVAIENHIIEKSSFEPVIVVKLIVTNDPIRICTSGDLTQLEKLHLSGYRLENKEYVVFKKLIRKPVVLSIEYLKILMEMGLNFGVYMPIYNSETGVCQRVSLFKYAMMFSTSETSKLLLQTAFGLLFEDDILAWIFCNFPCCVDELLPLLLFKHQVNPNSNYTGVTALGKAIYENNNLQQVQELLRAGADPNIKSRHQHPLKLACLIGNVEMVKLLVSADSFYSSKKLLRITKKQENNQELIEFIHSIEEAPKLLKKRSSKMKMSFL